MKGKSFWGRIALLAALFVAVLSAGMSLGLNTARVNAAVPEGTASITVSAGNVTSDMTYDEIKDVLVVTAFSGENGTGNNLGELDSADFEIVGVFAQGDSSTSTFKVVCGSVESVTFELPITVTSSQPREMTVTLNEGHGTIYSYTSLTTFQSYVTVHCVFWDGSERDLSQSEWGTNDNFTPETANVTESYDKEITIAYNAGTGTSNLTCDLLVEDIHPATPARLTVTGSQTVDANAAFGEYFTVRVEYGNDPFANAFVLAPGTYSIEYGNAAGTEFDSDATGFIYDNGAGTVRITYQENGAPPVSRLVQVTVRKIPTDPVSFSTASSNYQYTTQAENDGSVTVTGTDQTIQISNYYSDIMTITAVTKDNVAVDSSLYSAENGTITVRDAGEYQVTVQLTAPEYFFRNYPETQTSLTITYTVNRAPLNDLTLQLLDESDAPVTQWNRDDQITPTVTGNYGGGEVTYHYSGTNGTSYESNSLPTAAGSYEVYVSVAQSDNFREGQTSTISFQIGQRVLGLPTLAGAEGEGADLIYTGTSQAPTITYAGNNDATYLAITNNGGTDAGDYTVTFMINDATQAVWDTSAGSGITSDMLSNDNKTLTLEYQILPRRITMSTLSAVSSTYTGSEQEFTITNLNMPTNGTTGTAVTGAVNVSITPYDQGDTCSVSGSTFTVTNAGTYTITLALSSANYVWSDGSTAAIGCIFTMNKAVVDIPNAGSKTYDGSALTSNLENTDYYTVSQGTDWVNVKADGYPVTLTLRDTANYYWAGDTTSANNVNSASTATETVIFRITQASNGFISGPSITGWTYGDTANSPSGAEARFGTVEYRYSSSENGTYSTTVPTAADDYYVKAFVAETANWAAAESDAVLFTIEKRVIGITWTIGTYTYTGGEQAPTATATNVVSGDSLTLTVQGATDAGGHTATVTDITGTGADNYALPADCTTGFTISQATLTITWDEDTLSHTYDGVAFTPSYEVSGWQGSSNDGYTFTPEIADSNLLEGAAVNVGEYTVTLSISRSEGTCNYVLANNSIGFEITKAQLNIADYISEPEGYRGSNDDDRSIVYSGVLENSSLRYESSSLYTYVGRYGSDGTTASTATDVSADGYYIVLKLTYPGNYAWVTDYSRDAIFGSDSDGVADSIRVWFQITKTQFAVTVSIASEWAYGNDNGCAAQLTSENTSGGALSYRYYTDRTAATELRENVTGGVTYYTTDLPTDVGTYYVVAVIGETENYAQVHSTPAEFKITEREITVTITVSDGTYGSWSAATFAVDGNAGAGYDKITGDDIALVYTGNNLVNGVPRNAGNYSVTAQFKATEINFTLTVVYASEEDVSYDGTFTISPLALEVTGWSGNTNVYAGQGNSYQPTVTAFNTQYGDTVDGLGLAYEVTARGSSSLTGNAAVNVGDYTVTIRAIDNSNYTVTGGTNLSTTFTITPYTIAFTITAQNTVYGSFTGSTTGDNPDILIEYGTSTLNNENAQLSFSYAGTLNSGSRYTNKFEAGSYTVTVTIGNENYQLANGERTQQQPFTITQYTITSISWADRSFSYTAADQNDGNFATAAGVYGDGTLNLTETIRLQNGSDIVDFINAGSYTFTAGLTTEQAYNYALGSTFTEDYTIAPAEIEINIVAKSAVYRGSAYAASEVFTGGPGDSYSVSGSTFNVDLDEAISFTIAENLNAGSYNVTIAFTNPNFTVTGWTGDAGNQSNTFDDAFTIMPKLIMPTFTTDGGTYGAINEVVAAGNGWSVRELVPGEQQSVLGGRISYTSVDASDVWNGALSPAGSYTITLTITNKNYTFQEGSTVHEFTAADPLVIAKHTITSVSWETHDDLIYTGGNLYSEDTTYATAAGVNNDGTLNLTETITQNGGNIVDFINAGIYTFTAGLGDWSGNYQFAEGIDLTHTYEIKNATIIVSGVTGYSNDYDAASHNALNADYTATTVGGMTASWRFYEGETAPKADSEAWSATMPTFTNAGTHTVWYKVSADNHDDVINSVTVSIRKLAISIAIDGTITYGEALPSHTVGVDNNGAYTTRVTGSVDYAGSENFQTLLDTGLKIEGISSSDYSQSSGVGNNYSLTWTFSGEATNYTVTAAAGTLTVNRRAVTIWINDYDNGTYGQAPIANQLTWSVTNGSIYDNETLFSLATTATATSPVTGGPYYIYAVATPAAANYDITYTGSLTYSGAGAGEYIINPATVGITITQPNLNYNATAKIFTASVGSGLVGGEDISLVPTYYRFIGDDWDAQQNDPVYFTLIDVGDDYAPVDVGHYRVTFSSSNPNYTAADAAMSFAITQRTISVGITANGGTYSGSAYEASAAFSDATNDGQSNSAVLAELGSWVLGTDYTITYTGSTVTGTAYNSTTAPTAAGTYTATVTLGGTSTRSAQNYYLPTSTATFTISQKTLTITVQESAIVYGNAIAEDQFTVTYSGFVNGENENTEGMFTGTLGFDTSSTGGAYEPGAAAGRTFTVTASGLSSNNYAITYVSGPMRVTACPITVTIADQELTYTGANAELDQTAFSVTQGSLFSGDDRNDLGIRLSASGKDRGSYAITGSYTTTNYTITFAGSWIGGTAGTLTINAKDLTITAESVSVQYGNEPVYSVTYEGFVEGEDAGNLTGTLSYATANRSTGEAYAPGAAAGSIFTITPSGLSSNNYNITFATGTLTVRARIVTATVAVGGDGAYTGSPVTAVVEFSNVFGNDTISYETDYAGTTYGNMPYESSVAPTDAGEYTVTITITNSNYTFETSQSAKYDYNIAKCNVDVNWSESEILYTLETNAYTNSLTGYRSDIMEITSRSEGANVISFTVAENSVSMTVSNVDSYFVVVRLSDNAFINYTFGNTQTRTLYFSVSAEANSITFKTEADLDWTYGDMAGWTTDDALKEGVLSLTYGDARDVIFSYARYDENGTPEAAVYSNAVPTQAGRYWVRARYTGNAQYGGAVAYAAFEILPRTLTMPHLAEGSSAYTGETLSNQIVGFDGVTMGVVTTAATRVDSAANTIYLIAVSSGTYTVTITLKDSVNYCWPENTETTLTWVVSAADNAVTDLAFADRWTYGETPAAPTANATYGMVQFRYAAYDGNTDYEDITDWSNTMPTAAGTYVICAYATSTSNYGAAASYKPFEIELAKMTVNGVAGYAGTYDGAPHAARTAGTVVTVDGCAATWQYSLTNEEGSWQNYQYSYTDADTYLVYYKVSAPNHEDVTGSVEVVISTAALTVQVGNAAITYGEAAPDSYTLTYRGFMGNDSAAVVEGMAVFASGYRVGSDVGEYAVTVNGLSAKNYELQIVAGTLTVSAASITVTIADQGSVYGRAIVLDQSRWTNGELAVAGDNLEITLSKAEGSAAGTYAITGVSANENYNVTFVPGIYTITAAPITVTITSNGGVYGKITPATATLHGLIAADEGRVTAILTYTGTANDGITRYDNSTEAPKLAGTYTVTATVSDGNYRLTGVTSAVYVIERATVELPTAESKDYTGAPLTSDLIETDDYTVTQGTDWVNVGRYEVVLTLKYSANYRWANISGAEATVWFEIEQAENAFVSDPVLNGWTYGGTANEPGGAEAKYGTVVYMYSESEDGEYTTTAPTAAGDYYVKAFVAETANWAAAESAAVPFSIARVQLSVPAFAGDETTEYTGEQLSNAIGNFPTAYVTVTVSANATLANGTLYATNAGTHTVTFTINDTENYEWATGSTVPVVLTWQILSADDNAVTDLKFADEWIYGETPAAPTANALHGEVQFRYAVYDADTAYEAITDWSDTMPTAAGTYVICAYVTATTDYNAAAIYVIFEISPAQINVSNVAGYTGTYDGIAHNAITGGTATTVDNSAVTWQYSQTGTEGSWQNEQIELSAAGSYRVYYKVSAPNHADVTGIVEVVIYKAGLTIQVGNATINYGADAPGSYTLTYIGFMNGETQEDLGGTVAFTAEGYTAGAAAGSYAVTAEGYTSGNYEISYLDGTLTVLPVEITVTITSNGGVYGEITPATAALHGLIAADEGRVTAILTYTGTANDGITRYDNSTEVPKLAGTYTVTATVSGGNYTLTGVTSAVYVIERATVELPTAESKDYTGAPLTSDLIETDDYTVTQGTDWVNAGRYEVVLTLKDSANYRWANISGAEATVWFEITQAENAFVSDPVLNGWTYGGTANEPGGAEARFGTETIVYLYSESEEGEYTATVPTAAGTYYVKAFVAETANWAAAESAAVSFTIGRASVSVPFFRLSGSRYTGEQLSNQLVWFHEDIMRAAASAGAVVTDGVVYATNAGTYTVTISLLDTRSYVWANGRDTAVTLSWTISDAINNVISDLVFAAVWTYGETPAAPTANATYGTVQFRYAAYDGNTDYEDITDWSNTMPTAAGTYVICAYVTGTSDYNGAELYAEFTILPAEMAVSGIAGYTGTYDGAPHAARTAGTVVTVDGCAATWQYSLTGAEGSWQNEQIQLSAAGSYRVYYRVSAPNHADVTGYFDVIISRANLTIQVGNAAITYGEAAPGSYTLTYRGFMGNDSAAVVEGTAVFASGYRVGRGVGEYAVTVNGLSAANYELQIVEGTLTVNAAPITVTIEDQWSMYGEAIVLDQSRWTSGELAVAGDDLEITLSKAEGSAAGTYAITGVSANENYNVTFVPGIYTIYTGELRVTITANGGVYGGTITPATATVENLPDGERVNIILTYTGTANDGTSYNSTQVPTLAGTYTVTATVSGGNYTLTGVTSAVYVIERATVELPTAESKDYTGAPLTADLNETDEYTVTQGTDWVNAGRYEVVLTLKDSANYRWVNINGAEATVWFEITQAENAIVSDPVLNGWTYGGTANEPGGAEARFGTETIVYLYSESEEGEYTATVPTAAGTYYVKAFVAETANWAAAESEAVRFSITRNETIVPLPTLEYSSSVYNGTEQRNEIRGYDALLMEISGNAPVVFEDGKAILRATNAGVYTVTITLREGNYSWAEGSVTLTWTIEKLAVEKPTAAQGTWVADGSLLTYLPEGLDPDVMQITGNITVSAGTYLVTVTLRDAKNYMWSDGTNDIVVFNWRVAEEEISLLWLIILLACLILVEVCVLVIGIVRRKKSGKDGSDPDGGQTRLASVAGLPALLAVIASAQVVICIVLGCIALVLLAAILVVFLKKKKQDTAEEQVGEPTEEAEGSDEGLADEAQEVGAEQPEEEAAVSEDMADGAADDAAEEPAAEVEELSETAGDDVAQTAEESAGQPEAEAAASEDTADGAADDAAKEPAAEPATETAEEISEAPEAADEEPVEATDGTGAETAEEATEGPEETAEDSQEA